MARSEGETVVDGAESELVAGHVGLIEGSRDLRLEENDVGLHGCIGREFLTDGKSVSTAVHMVEG